MNNNALKNELLSIIIPSYNRKEFISNAIESILKQTYKQVEIVLVDDCSTDGTEEYIKNMYSNNSIIKFYKNERNLGAGLSRKNGLNKSKGNYLIFMDDDDYYTDYNFFKDAIDILRNKKNISFVSSSSIIEYVDENKKIESIMNIKGEINNIEYLSSFQQKYMKSNSTFTTIFRKNSLEKANIQDVDMLNDSTIYLRALLEGNAYVLENISGIYRVHSKNISSNLNTDFIIENLNEKKKVYEEIKIRKLLEKPEKWIKEQLDLTISFFIEYNKIDDIELKKLITWCEDNFKGIKEEILEIFNKS